MLRELQVIGLEIGDFLDNEEMRLTREQFNELNRILARIHDLEDKIRERRDS